MLKALIVHVPSLNKEDDVVTSSINYFATGLFSLASEIQKEGVSVEIINLGIEKYLDKNFLLSEYIEKNSINFAAFSLHWHNQAYDVIETIREIKKKNPNLYISLGGLTASYYAEEILTKYDFVDSVIKGEGEISIRKLVKSLMENNLNYDLIPNLCYIKNGHFISNEPVYSPSKKEFNSFTFFHPDVMRHYEDYLKTPFIIDYSKENELKENSHSHILLGRGCLGNCLWCGGGYLASKKLSGRKEVVYRNTEDVINEISILKKKYGVNNFSFSYDPKGKERGEIITLLDKIKEEFQGAINAYYNLDGLADEDFLIAFKNAFSENSILAMSPVFANEELRKKYKSFYYSNEELEKTLNIMEELKINSDLYFSTMPDIDEKENTASREYGESLKSKYEHIKNILIYPVFLEPGAILFENSKNKKTFSDYYNETYSIEKSFENKAAFI